MQAGNSVLHEVGRRGQLHLCFLLQPTTLTALPNTAALHGQRGTGEAGGGLAVTARATAKWGTGLGSSITATKTSSGPSDYVIRSLPFVHPEARKGSGTGEGSSLAICMPEGCLPSHLVLP